MEIQDGTMILWHELAFTHFCASRPELITGAGMAAVTEERLPWLDFNFYLGLCSSWLTPREMERLDRPSPIARTC
jgi:hypothetical protein